MKTIGLLKRKKNIQRIINKEDFTYQIQFMFLGKIIQEIEAYLNLNQHFLDVLSIIIIIYQIGYVIFQLSIGNNINPIYFAHTQKVIYFMSSKRLTTARSRTSKPKEQLSKPRGFGRPQDDALETFFMKKLRNCKLQVINAESQAQIQLFRFQDINPEAITQRKLTNDDDDYSKQKMLMIKNWFKEIDEDHYELLWNSFKHGVQTWEFKQITSEKDFPEYLFCDECDLSYVLYTALKSPIQGLKKKTQFTETQLLFFQLLCFTARDQISFRIIKSFKEITDQIIKNMGGVKEKVMLHYKNSILTEKDEENSVKNQDSSSKKMDQIMQHQGIPLELIKGAAVKIPDTEEEKKFKNIKTKKIEKQQKSIKVGRPKTKPEVLEETIQFKDIQVLLHKLITHIAWAYRYIYPSEEKKKQLMSAQ